MAEHRVVVAPYHPEPNMAPVVPAPRPQARHPHRLSCPRSCHPSRRPPSSPFRALQEAIRLSIWDYASEIGYNPWQAMIAMALAKDTPPDLKLDCHKEVAAYLLSKLASIKVEGEVAHVHASMSLRELMEVWEREEEEAKASLPPWTPPGFDALDMQQDADGVWDLDNEDDVED